MVATLFFYELALVVLVWLFLLLYWLWPHDSVIGRRLISKRLWDKLNEDERKILLEATLEARDYQRTVAREQDGKAIEALKTEGMTVGELPAEEVAKFRDKAKPVADKHAKEVDPALVQQLKDEIIKVRGKS